MTKSKYHTDGQTTPSEIRDATGGLISLNTARIWLKGERPKSKAAQAVLLLVAKLKGTELPTQLPESKPVKPKEKPLREKEGIEIQALPSKVALNVFPGNFKVKDGTIYFVGNHGVLSAKHDAKAQYFVMVEDFKHTITFNQSQTFGAFKLS